MKGNNVLKIIKFIASPKVSCSMKNIYLKKNHIVFHPSYQPLSRNLSNQRIVYPNNNQLSDLQYETVCNTTLDSLSEKFELLGDEIQNDNYDVEYSNGVLTVKFSKEIGTIVINKQSPNKQIWLSSPISGPKRYDFVNGRWIYKHDNTCLHDLLTKELSSMLNTQISFKNCEHS